MICRKCGCKLQAGSRFCPRCGQRTELGEKVITQIEKDALRKAQEEARKINPIVKPQRSGELQTIMPQTPSMRRVEPEPAARSVPSEKPVMESKEVSAAKPAPAAKPVSEDKAKPESIMPVITPPPAKEPENVELTTPEAIRPEVKVSEDAPEFIRKAAEMPRYKVKARRKKDIELTDPNPVKESSVSSSIPELDELLFEEDKKGYRTFGQRILTAAATLLLFLSGVIFTVFVLLFSNDTSNSKFLLTVLIAIPMLIVMLSLVLLWMSCQHNKRYIVRSLGAALLAGGIADIGIGIFAQKLASHLPGVIAGLMRISMVPFKETMLALGLICIIMGAPILSFYVCIRIFTRKEE